eukprot:jgi/Antlo1/2517/1713
MSRSLLCVLPGLSEKVACSKRCIRPRLSTAALDCAVSRRLAEVRLHEACTREEAAEWCSMLRMCQTPLEDPFQHDTFCSAM